MSNISKKRINLVYNSIINKDVEFDEEWYYGFLEASLISVGFIKNYETEVLGKPLKKIIKKWYGYKEVFEDRKDVILRLTKEYLEYE